MYHVTNHEMYGSNGLQLVPAALRTDAAGDEAVGEHRDAESYQELDGDSSSTACSTMVAGPGPKSGVNGKRVFVACPEHIEDSRLRDAVDYVHRHLEDPIGVQELINHVCVSRRWLEYAFRDEIGVTPYQYIRMKRLEHAGDLLVSEPMTKIYQVARRTGFSSAKQLTMAFRQHYGVSPREYRREARLHEERRVLV